ncbi:MAG TPA: hypothetical protein VF618_23200 [Thermoanaerobaculia bacterium]
MRLNELAPGKASYNLACIQALRGDADGCRKWLLDSEERGFLPSRDHLLNDSDLNGVRQLPWFAEIVARAKA